MFWMHSYTTAADTIETADTGATVPETQHLDTADT